MLPLRDANPTRRFPAVTLAIIAANVLVFLLWQPTFASGENAEAKQETFFLCHAAIAYEVSHTTSLAEGGPSAREAIEETYGGGTGTPIQSFLARRCPGKSWLASILVAMFLHAGWLHIGGNMLFLWIFGNNIEDRMGPIGFLFFYLLGGFAAFGTLLATDPNAVVPTLGASGAIAAVLGAYLVLYPRARVLTLFFYVVVTLPAWLVLGSWFVLQLFNGVGGLGTNVNGGIAYGAHVGGFVFGVAVAWLLLRRRRPDRWLDPFPPPRPDLLD